MSEEELEKVAGGTSAEVISDSQFLHAIGIMNHSYSANDYVTCDVQYDVEGAFQKVIPNLAIEGCEGANLYFLMSGTEDWRECQEISRADVLKMVCDKVSPGFDYKKYL